MEPPCQCPGPGFCSRYQIEQTPYAHGVCTGNGLPGFPVSPGKSEAYRRKWRLATGDAKELPAPNPVVMKPAGGPGTELKELLSSIGVLPNNCSCNARAGQMDFWGVDGCRLRREEIVGWLREQWEQLGWMQRTIAGIRIVFGGGPINLKDPIGAFVDEAIRRAEERIR